MDRSWNHAHAERQLSETLDVHNFTALSSGLGLGELRPRAVKPKASAETLAMVERMRSPAMPQSQFQSQSQSLVENRHAASSPAERSVAPPPRRGFVARLRQRRATAGVVHKASSPSRLPHQEPASVPSQKPYAGAQRAAGAAPAPARAALSRRLLAWSVDFVFVVSSLAVAAALAAVLTAVRTGETDNPLALAPVQWLVSTSPYVILAGVYGVFFAYGLLFKLLAGRTFGEVVLRVNGRGGGFPRKMARP